MYLSCLRGGLKPVVVYLKKKKQTNKLGCESYTAALIALPMKIICA
jgi:hypothetical protein